MLREITRYVNQHNAGLHNVWFLVNASIKIKIGALHPISLNRLHQPDCLNSS